MKECLYCENNFESKVARAKFCSNLCRATFYQNFNRGDNGEIIIRIYALVNPITDKVFYVGKTVGSLEQRLSCHIKEKNGNPNKAIEINKILLAGKRPCITLLEEISCLNEDNEGDALMREDYWIQVYREENPLLCNVAGVFNKFKPRLLSTYKKETKRTFNHSIRFDEDKLDFFKRENPGIDKPQQVVDFFLDEFWWKHNGKWISPKEISEVPTLARQKQPDKKELVHKSDAPDPSDKGAYLKWLKNQ